MDLTLGRGGFLNRLSERGAAWSRAAMLAAAYPLVVGGASVAVNATDAIDGSLPALGRAVLGLIGVAAGIVLWTRKDQEVFGWRLALVWALIQIPIVAWDKDGSITTQLIRFPLMASSETRVNGVVTSSSELGINLVAIFLAGVYARQQGTAVIRGK